MRPELKMYALSPASCPPRSMPVRMRDQVDPAKSQLGERNFSLMYVIFDKYSVMKKLKRDLSQTRFGYREIGFPDVNPKDKLSYLPDDKTYDVTATRWVKKGELDLMETFISSVETSVQPPNTPVRSVKFGRNALNHGLFVQFARQKEISSLKKLIREKDSRIDQLAKEIHFLYEELDRLRAQGEEELKKSDALIEQMQAASEESSKRAHAIILHLSKQIETQAEQIEYLQDTQGLGGAVRQLKSKLPFLRIGSTKQEF